MTLQAGAPIGKYVVRRKIAEGGMAEVYLASSVGAEGFEKDVAIKRIRAFLASEPGFKEMFIAEARLASKLNHANVVQIFDFDKHEDTYYLAMEFVHGHSLWDVRKRSKELMRPMSPILVAHIGAEVARGLAYAHRLTDKGKPLNLVHRDVTPHNVLLSYDGAVKLTDFGVAKAGNSQTAAGVLKGKFAYMSPEQSRGEPVDSRTDVFALGIVLWEMLTGGRLFDGDTDVAVLRAVQERTIAPPARLNPEVPAEIDAAVMRALERDLSKRFASAADLERALGEALMKHARSLEERDVGAYLRGLFPEDVDQDERRDSTRATPAPGMAPGMAPAMATPKPREPTAIMGGLGRPLATPAPLSPDEDFNASTHVVERARGPATEQLPSMSEADRAAVSAALKAKDQARDQASLEPKATPGAEAPVGGSAVSASRSSSSVVVSPALAAELASAKAAQSKRTNAVAGAGGVALLLAMGAGYWFLFHGGGAPATSTPAQSTIAASADPVGAPSTAPASDTGATSSTSTPATTNSQTPTAQPESTADLPKAEAPKPEAQTADATKPDVTVQPAVATVPTGTLIVRVIPYAAVYLDGKRLDRELSGMRKFKVPAGKHKLVLKHDLKGEKTFDFVLDPNGKADFNHDFRR